jgi:hypothetical protein
MKKIVIFSDASWKDKKIPGHTGTEATGNGLFIQLNTAEGVCSIMIQALSEQVPSPV